MVDPKIMGVKCMQFLFLCRSKKNMADRGSFIACVNFRLYFRFHCTHAKT
jgi:hypothetical protein